MLLFGGKKIPELMKGLGKGVKSFKDGVKGIEDDIEMSDKETRIRKSSKGGTGRESNDILGSLGRIAKCPVSYSCCCSAIYNSWILFQGSAFAVVLAPKESDFIFIGFFAVCPSCLVCRGYVLVNSAPRSSIPSWLVSL